MKRVLVDFGLLLDNWGEKRVFWEFEYLVWERRIGIEGSWILESVEGWGREVVLGSKGEREGVYFIGIWIN